MSLVVVVAQGLVTIQDLGRPGHMHEAVPPGGALVPELAITANRHADNPDDAPVVEVMGRLVVRAEQPVTIGTNEAGFTLGAGHQVVIASDTRRAVYLTMRGGIDAPVVLGGRGTLLCAGLGRIVRAGDRLVAAPRAPIVASPNPPLGDGPIRVMAGPDAFPPEALATLTAAPYRISRSSDRVGTRLDGAPLPTPAMATRSRPMVRGAIEVPGDGLPIVLGPEHPTTGGYPIIGVIARADLGRFFDRQIGRDIRFVVG
jgi:allophanate hydrolase subunit 2